MDIEIDYKEVIPFKDFELKWRWDETHNPDISDSDIAQLQPLSETESKRLNKVISHFEKKDTLSRLFTQSDWISANSEKPEQFRMQLASIVEPWKEGVIVTWNNTTTLRTTKEIFQKYWDDFCYPSSDDVTIISEKTNWIMFYSHSEIANIWIRQ